MAGVRKKMKVKVNGGRIRGQAKAERVSKRAGTGGLGQAAAAIRRRRQQERELLGN